MAAPFISTAALQAVVGKDVSDDPLAAIALDTACEKVRWHLGRTLNYVADDAVVLNGQGHEAQMLPEFPVVNVTVVTLDDVELDAADYYWDRRAGLLYRTDGSCWTRGIQNLAVTYSHGYAVEEADVEDDPSDDVPKPDRLGSDIREIALQVASRIYLGSGTGTDDVQESPQGPGPTTLTDAERHDLSPHRRVMVG